jgi:hypothetical protein
MPTQISTSLTTADVRAYMYPPDVEYVMDPPNGGDVLYTLELVPRESR